MSLTDQQAMQRAIELANNGIYSTQPNPRVGCVLIKGGEIIGEAAHLKAGELHAERLALKVAGSKAYNSTAYVTLEPCCHWGRTPPCCDALIEHGVKRVVIAMVDPNPKVAGKGIDILRAAGIDVEVGLLEELSVDLNRGYIKRMKEGRPYVRAKLAMSLDGKIAMADGESQWITAVAARIDVQCWRARSCAVITGSETVAIDNPSLNVRWEQLEDSKTPKNVYRRQPRRVIIDSNASTSTNSKMLQLEGETWLATLSTDAGKRRRWEQVGGHWHQAEPAHNKVSLKKLLESLAADSCNEVLVEAGSGLVGAFASSGLVDEYVIYIAPKLLGKNAQSLLSLPDVRCLADHKSVKFVDVRQLGEDLCVRAVAQ